ncbi:reverse transcriptase domain protein [Metarhizium robertsii]|uniref:Reverse transcriptase domain protein n=1 Tax=Metarhizium robertsii TaxID=568076 RepID=A0A014P1I1_9HYPO|nr:reverse transcriptase domain protein [Metarhizium robertsii]
MRASRSRPSSHQETLSWWYWRELIDSFTNSSSVFKAVRWLRAPGTFQPPPLQVGDVVHKTQADKANALLPQRSIPFAQTIPLEEARAATIGTGNTSPGSDNITVKLLEAVWDVTGTHIRRLYEGCLRVGHHPKPFQEAEVVMIAKPGRGNLSIPRAWRPISLLSCLGRGLERLIARRLAWAAIHHGVLHLQQAGALPKRSAVDLVTALIYDIEKAFAWKLVATLVTMNIQGAFDTVLRNRLILRLREQGWREHLVRCVAFFMHDRSACVRYQDTTTPVLPLQCSLPQGSPVSPILFLLYTEPLYCLGNPMGRFGYADDTAILCTGNSLEETAAEASEQAAELIARGAENGVSFDPEKTKVMHFSPSPRKPETAPPVYHGTVEKRPEPAMRWLGIWLDRKLTFKTHVEKWTAKAQAVAYHLKDSETQNTTRSPAPSKEPSQCCCMELRRGTQAHPGPAGLSHLHSPWRTTPPTTLHRESGIPPATLLPEARRIRFSSRLKALDDAHPLARRTLSPAAPAIIKAVKRKHQVPPAVFPTRLRRTDRLLPSCPRPALIRPRFSDDSTMLQTASEEVRSRLPSMAAVGATGDSDCVLRWSLSSEGVAGYGYIIHQNNRPVLDGSGRLGPAEVFDAAANGALEGLWAAVGHPQATANEIVVCLDNLAAATGLRGTSSDSSQAAFLEFQDMALAHGNTTVRWIPGHTNIAGNEQADALAKAGCSRPAPPDALPTLVHLRRVARKQPREAFDAWWTTAAPERYKPLKLKASTRCAPDLATPRPALHHLLAARTHHGDFADYHRRFKHANARPTCSCGRPKEPKHLFYCRKMPPHHRLRLAPSPETAVNQALGKEFVKMADNCGFFEKICPRY